MAGTTQQWVGRYVSHYVDHGNGLVAVVAVDPQMILASWCADPANDFDCVPPDLLACQPAEQVRLADAFSNMYKCMYGHQNLYSRQLR